MRYPNEKILPTKVFIFHICLDIVTYIRTLIEKASFLNHMNQQIQAQTEHIIRFGAMAVIRLHESVPILPIADALLMGGIRTLEVTLTTPNALSMIEQLSQSYGTKMLIGAGSVINPKQVQDVASAGGSFIVSPITKKEIIDAGHALDCAVLPGAFTPTEVFTAHEWGADMVKIFPAQQLGTGYLKALLAPLPHLKCLPTGGVTPDNAGTWIHAGAQALGIGSALIDPESIRNHHYSMLTDRATILSKNITEARQILRENQTIE